MTDYVSLHNHCEYSVLDGFSHIREYLDAVEKVGQKGLGLADHGNLSNSYKFLTEARKRGLTAVPGVEMYMAPVNPEGAKVQKPVFYGRNGRAPKYDVSSNGSYLHLTIWAYNETGLKNLFRLSSISYEKEHSYKKNKIDFDHLAAHNEGLVVATGCPSSEISTRFLLNQDKKAYEYASRLQEVFGKDRLFVEVMNHNMADPLERILLPKQVKLAKDMGLRLLATNDSHYAYKENAPHHEEMLCSQSGSVMSDRTYNEGGNRFAFDGSEYYIKTTEQMAALFPEDEFPGALSSSLLIAEMAQDLKISPDPHLRPKALVPEGFTEVTYFQHLIKEGLQKLYGDKPADIRKRAKEQAAYEFRVIHSSDFIGYFLTVREYITWTVEKYSVRDEDGQILALPVGAGRGSVGGSIIAYLLGISQVDPLEYNLVFERFLSDGRGATYRITYDDGTHEDIIVSSQKQVIEDGKKVRKYIHELQAGDTVL